MLYINNISWRSDSQPEMLYYQNKFQKRIGPTSHAL